MPPHLNSRNKWFPPRENLEIGDYVLVSGPRILKSTLPRSLWEKEIVTRVHRDEDGLVRSVIIKDSKQNKYVPPIHKLCLIATCAELEQEN